MVDLIRDTDEYDEKVLEAMMRVPRHRFLESAFSEAAYSDRALPTMDGQTISQPRMVAMQSTLLNVTKGCKTLEIGTGSGYQAAILCELGAKVFTVERYRGLHARAQKILDDLGYKLRMKWGDGSEGWEANAPYDRILVTAGAAAIPQPLLRQLSPGGKMVIPLGGQETQKLVVIDKKENGEMVRTEMEECRFVPMIGKNAWKDDEL